ncbi:MAG: hypothetical protein M3297_02130 [Thermoproteota archaeon]|nr:hypothetical protein [Thermoproteota archaeon]
MTPFLCKTFDHDKEYYEIRKTSLRKTQETAGYSDFVIAINLLIQVARRSQICFPTEFQNILDTQVINITMILIDGTNIQYLGLGCILGLFIFLLANRFTCLDIPELKSKT